MEPGLRRGRALRGAVIAGIVLAVSALAAAASVGAGTLAWETLKAVFFLLPLALTLWAFLDVAHRPSWAWALAGRSRITWLVLIALGVLTLLGGIVISSWYLVRVRPIIAAAGRGEVPLDEPG